MGKPRYRFAELVDIAQLQALMDRLSTAIGISNSIVDVDGTRLTNSGWEDACTHYHRAHPASCRRCAASDTSLLDSSDGKTSFVIFRCPNGLIDTASPIIVEGEHLASVFTGQVLTEAPDLDFFRRQARTFGYDETAYLDAINRVPRRSAEYIKSATLLFSQLAGILAEIGLNRLRQVKAAEVLAELNKTLESKVAERTRELDEANAVLQSGEALFKQILDASSVAIFLLDRSGHIVQANERMAEMFARPLDELTGAEYGSLVHPTERASAQRHMQQQLALADPELRMERVYRRTDENEFWGYLTCRRIVDADGSERGVVGVIADISERKYAEELIEKRIVALTQPLDGAPIALEDLFKREELQRIQDDFANAVGVSSNVTYPDGTPFTVATNSSHLCSGLIRKTEKGCANCLHSDAVIGRYHPEGPIVQQCMSGGLWDAGASITVGGRHVANWLIGQVRDETQSEESIRAYAREIGADEEEVAKAFQKITPMSRERFDKIARALFTMANQLSTSAFQNIQQARAITELKEAEKKLQLAASVFTHAREGIMITAADGTIIEVNDAFTRITGYARKEVIGQTPRILSSGRQEKAFYASLWHDLTDKGHWYGEIWNRRKSGEVYAVMQTIGAVRDGRGEIAQYVALFSDITTLKEHQSQLEHIAHYDALTTLPNRVLLADRMRQAMTQTLRRGNSLAVAYLDLDGFKAVNDRHGHETGDQLLITIATRMKQTLREGDTLARLGGDEFVAVLQDLDDVATCVPMLNRLLEAAAQSVRVGDHLLQVSASLGLTFYPQAEETDADQLLRQADQAMYHAKLLGKNRFHVFDAEQDRNLRGHHESLENIRRALGAHEFVLYYQPKVNMRSGETIGVEALIRWQHPERGLLSPAVFLPVIEEHPLAVEVGEWVIEAALLQLEAWRAIGLDIPISVNVGARQLQQADFIERLRTRLAAHPSFHPGALEMEVLETSALEDLARVSQVIEACREIGIGFALDDFGTGYSSLTYLKRLSVAQLKIDQSFVRDMLDDPDDLAILGGVLGLASALHRQVIAEGVATVEHGTMLLQLGCELAQGYGIAHPMPAAEIPAWVRTWRPEPAWTHLPTVRRDDLPLLFAGAEHRAWIGAIAAFVRDERDDLPLIHHHCRFDQWLESEGRERHADEPAFLSIVPVHRAAHELAAHLCALRANGQGAKAMMRLNELHALHDDLLERLQAMVREAP